MFLRDLSVETPRRSLNSFGRNGIAIGIEELYLSCLGKFYSGDFAKVIVETDQMISDFSVDKMIDVIKIRKSFDFEKYKTESLLGRRKMVLDVLQSGLLTLADLEGWNKLQLLSAYECCVSKNLEMKILYKNKFWRSPDHKLYAGIFNCWEVEQFEAYIIFLNKDKNEIYRTKLMESEYWNLEPFGKVGWSDDSSHFFVFSKDGSRKWAAGFEVK